MARLSKFQTIINDRLEKISEELDRRDLTEVCTTDLVKFFQDTAKLREKAPDDIDETNMSYAEMAARRGK